MKICKSFLAILFLLSIHMALGKLELTTGKTSVLDWALEIGNILRTGAVQKVGLWGSDVIPAKYSNFIFEEGTQVLLKELGTIGELEDYLEIRFSKGTATLDQWVGKSESITPKILQLKSRLEDINSVAKELQSLAIFDFIIPQQLCTWATRVVEKGRISTAIDRFFSDSSSTGDSLPISDLIREISQNAIDTPTRCGDGFSPSDFLHTIYDLVVIAEMRGFIIEGFSHHLLSTYQGTTGTCKYSKGNWESSMESLWKTLRSHMEKYNNLFIGSLNNLSMKKKKEFRACEPDSFIRDESFFELEGAMQRYVHAYEPASLGHSGKPVDCSLLEKRNQKSEKCEEATNFCALNLKYPCMGYMIDCEPVSTSAISACPSTERPRRYVWINKTDDEAVEHCNKQTFQSGSACFCTCIDNGVNSISTHLFNLQPVEADVANGMVITGIRFIVQNGVMQFQIQQGKLGNDWRIQGKPEWKPIDDITEKIRAERLGRKLLGKSPGVVEGHDYLIIREGTGLYLDALSVPEGHVLTGVKFDLAPREAPDSPQRIQVAIISRPVNIISKTLNNLQDKVNIVKPDVTERTEFVYTRNALKPFRGDSFSGLNQWVAVTTSNLEYDGGQTTLPYFDGSPVETDPPTALGGLGIFYKQGRDSNNIERGMVSLECSSIEYVHFMK